MFSLIALMVSMVPTMKQIPGYEGRYSATKDGRIWSHTSHGQRFLKTCPDKDGYLKVTLTLPGSVQVSHTVHRLMGITYLGAKRGQLVDHKDRDVTNNILSNLRICGPEHNRAHAKRMVNNTSGFKGVHWLARRNRWVARIKALGRRIRLGSFKTAAEAGAAYDVAAIKYFGQFALLNAKEHLPQ